MKMKTMLKLGALAIMMIAGAAQTNAATTNLVQNIGFNLVFYEQGTNLSTNLPTDLSLKRLRVTTKDIIAALGTATSNSFSADARLVLVTDLASTNGAGTIEIQEGTNAVDVSSYFTETNSAFSVTGSFYKGGDNGWMVGLDNDSHHDGKLAGSITYDILHLTLAGPKLKARLDVNGFNATTQTTLANNGTSISVDETIASVAGTGADVDGTPAIIQGSITILGHDMAVQ